MKTGTWRCIPPLLWAAGGVWAQDAAPVSGQTVTLTPRVSVSETLTSNADLSGTHARSDQITELTPGLRLTIQGARLSTYLDYSLSRLHYAQGSADDELQNRLAAVGRLEAVENRAFIDFGANVSQQAISAFGPPSASDQSINRNRTEVASYRLSPSVQGRLGAWAGYEARISRSLSRSDDAAATDSASTDSLLRISNAAAFRDLGWSASWSRQRQAYTEGRTTESDQLSLGLNYSLSPQLRVQLNAGSENSNFDSLDKERSNTHSLGLDWQPSERTRVSALSGQRAFGRNHNWSFEHRSARTVWRFSDSKDISTPATAAGLAGAGTMFQLFDQQFASQEPDPVARARLVNDYLQANGIDPDATAINNFLTAALSVQRRQDLSFALQGRRDTVTFALTRTETRRIDRVSDSADSLSEADTITQDGVSVNLSHRLTPDYSLGVVLSHQTTSGDTAQQETRLRSLSLNLSGKLGRRTAASLNLRRALSDGASEAYTETALTGQLHLQF